MDQLSRPGAAVTEADADAVRGVVLGDSEGSLSAVRALPDGQLAVAFARCGPRSCVGKLALLARSGGSLQVRRSVTLPVPVRVWTESGYEFLGLAELPLDAEGGGSGDGAKGELAVYFRVSEPPRRALGSRAHEYLLLYNAPSLQLSWSREVRTSGGASEPECTTTLHRPDINKDGHPDLATAQSCLPGICRQLPERPECKAKPGPSALYVWQASTRRYVAQQLPANRAAPDSKPPSP